MMIPINIGQFQIKYRSVVVELWCYSLFGFRVFAFSLCINRGSLSSIRMDFCSKVTLRKLYQAFALNC